MLYTGKGDDGTTKLFDCPQGERINKSDFVFEVLGTLDELNSSLGYAKALSKKSNDTLSMETQKISYEEILETFQQSLFCIQAELGGSDIHATKAHILYLEKVIHEIEALLPPIKSFIVPGGGETGAYLDIARTIARRTERQLIVLLHKKERIVSNDSIVFMNRLSSSLYALARFANYQEGYSEKNPGYR
ncbi:MAG: cob(I)yrinic acid a,c-diamide adenosyltransferase [Candidatus Staskawiczbacteria bacterium]|nr:cob(I)yrinic acid a,c-diamide adenosyltransferase [Candidatus Staskawiczbacteria bacterium]